MSNKYIPGIDGVRALAVISVILFHFFPSLIPGGFVGVDIFFVISGYVVTGSLINSYKPKLFSFILDFYERRLIRLYPALIIMLVLTFIIQTLFVPPSWLSNTTSKIGLLSFFGLANVGLLLFDDGYFSPKVEFNPFTHTWSLGVEEQFYFVAPFIIFFIAQTYNRKNPAILLFASLAITSFFACLFFSYSNAPFAFYTIISRFWELSLGSFLFLFHAETKPKSHSNIISYIGFLCVILGMIFSKKTSFPLPWALLPTVGTTLLIHSIVLHSNVNKSFVIKTFESKLAVYIGKISYPLYLFHWPILVFARWTIGLSSPLSIVLSFFVFIVMSVLTYHLVEKGELLRRFRTSYSQIKRISVVVSSIVFCSFIGIILVKSQPYLSLSVTKNKIIWYPTEVLKNDSTVNAFLANSNFKSFKKVPKIYFWGDSHTSAYITLASILRNHLDTDVQVMFKGGCGVANLIKPLSTDCQPFFEQSLHKILSEAKANDIVILSSLRTYRLSDQWTLFDEQDVQKKIVDNRENFSAAFRQADTLIKLLTSKGIVVVIETPKPVFLAPPYRCSDWFNHNNPICSQGFVVSKKLLIKNQSYVTHSIEQLEKIYPNIIVWNTFDKLCSDTEVCNAFYGKYPLFNDGDHLSGFGNIFLYQDFLKILDKIVNSEKNN